VGHEDERIIGNSYQEFGNWNGYSFVTHPHNSSKLLFVFVEDFYVT